MKKIKSGLFLFFVFLTVAYPQQETKKIALFLAKDFPSADIRVTGEAELRKITAQYSHDILSSISSLNEKLNRNNYRLLILPYGSAFPLDAWETICNFLESGGSLLYLGGSPFNQPVIFKDSVWIKGIPQQTFARRLLIGPSEKIEINSEKFYAAEKRIGLNNFSAGVNDLKNLSTVYGFTVRFTAGKEFPAEDGSSGPRDAVLRPLIQLINGEGYPFAAPVIEIDRLQGRSAGGRWIFSASNAELSENLINKLIDRALEGAIEFTANPVFASIYKGEVPLIRVNLFRPGNRNNNPVNLKVTVKDSLNRIVFQLNRELNGTPDFHTSTIELRSSKSFKEGFYSVEIEALNITHSPSSIATGFWVWDDKLALQGPRITASKDWLLKDGEIFPVIGTTYMASDVHRKFLFEPNPFTWIKDFELMKKTGINFIRTGFWNSWSRSMLDRGAIDESFLRALDAYVMTAARFNIVVCLNFFAFTPPLNGGTNPYLDPRAIEWQKTFITLITTRYKNVGWIHYDLINEPSYSPPNDIWKNAPIGDRYEKEAWQIWINKRHKNSAAQIQNLWRDPFGDIHSPPSESELNYRIYKEDRRPRKALDFNLFTQDVVTAWADTLNKVIKSVSNSLVTLGQDEGGTGNRPSQQFHYTGVDYTSIHTWWLNDDLMWDGLMTKVPEKPNLVSETGLMRLEDIDGNPWRTPDNAKNLLDRKFALGFASRGAGIVQWAWNINPYMPIDNESVIGIFRPDGTAKKEIETIRKFSSFFTKAAEVLRDFDSAEVVVVIPHTKIFSGRKNGDLSTRRIVRALTDHFGITPVLLSEFRLSYDRIKNSRLIIVPSAEFLDENAAATLINAARNGIKVLFTGSLEGNSYGEISKVILETGLTTNSKPVSMFEKFRINESGADLTVTFDNQQNEFIKKCDRESLYYAGNIFHEPLPIELAKEKEPLILLLKMILNESGIDYSFSSGPVSTSILAFDDKALVVFVNESSASADREIILNGFKIKTGIEAGSSKILIADKKNGKILIESD